MNNMTQNLIVKLSSDAFHLIAFNQEPLDDRISAENEIKNLLNDLPNNWQIVNWYEADDAGFIMAEFAEGPSTTEARFDKILHLCEDNYLGLIFISDTEVEVYWVKESIGQKDLYYKGPILNSDKGEPYITNMTNRLSRFWLSNFS